MEYDIFKNYNMGYDVYKNGIAIIGIREPMEAFYYLMINMIHNIDYDHGGTGGVGGQQDAAFDKPYYHISLRLLRVVSDLVEKY